MNTATTVQAHPASIDAYIRHGWSLVPIPAGTKGPRTPGWNIKTNALSWSITYAEADEVDNQNILNCVIRCMHKCCNEIFAKIERKYSGDGLLLVDGNYFRPYMRFDETTETFINVPHETVEKGDGTYSSIAAASILAKHARDSYIAELCVQHPLLAEWYSLDKNMGYGTKAHIEGIRAHGITQYHRKSFNICRGENETKL